MLSTIKPITKLINSILKLSKRMNTITANTTEIKKAFLMLIAPDARGLFLLVGCFLSASISIISLTTYTKLDARLNTINAERVVRK